MESVENFSDQPNYDSGMSDADDDSPGRVNRNRDKEDEAEEVQEPTSRPGEQENVKPKRIVKNPLPKLDAVRLMGPRGIGILQSTFRDIKFKGNGFEKDDLNLLLKALEHWAHRLYPKLMFDDSLKQIEKLGTKQNIQNLMKRIRLDMFQSDEMPHMGENTEGVPEPDVFDQLLGSDTAVGSPPSHSVGPLDSRPVTTPAVVLTPEQRERVERNRLIAVELKKARMMQKENTPLPVEDDVPFTPETINGEATEVNLVNKSAYSQDELAHIDTNQAISTSENETSKKFSEDEILKMMETE